MKSMLSIAVLAAVPVLASVAPALGIGDCPHERASDVAAHIRDSGGSNQCYLGVVIFGWEIGIRGATCPLTRFVYPAHQECLGAASHGNMCVIEGSINVLMQDCACIYLGWESFGLGLPGCRCRDVGTAGSMQDAATKPCPPVAF